MKGDSYDDKEKQLETIENSLANEDAPEVKAEVEKMEPKEPETDTNQLS